MGNELKTSVFDKKVRFLGAGVTGKVDLFKGKSLYAVKAYDCKEKYESSEEYKQRVSHEYEVLNKLDHFNVIKVYKFTSSKFNSKVSLYMEYGGSTVTEMLKKTETSEILCMYKQIINGVHYLHDNNVCHRDLKFDNVLMNEEGYIKLIDFFDSSTKPESYGIVGTDRFVAPEVFSKIKYNGLILDIWSLGIMLYYIHFKKYPWKLAQLDNHGYKDFLDHGLDLNGVPSGVKTCLQNMITTDDKRWNIDKLIENEWIDQLHSCKLGIPCGYDHSRLFK